MPELEKRPRPELGTMTTTFERIPVCKTCGYIVDVGLCTYGCPLDGDHYDKDGHTIYAVYETTRKFVREE